MATDLNGDGKIDLVVGSAAGPCGTYYGNGIGKFVRQTGTADPFAGIDVGRLSAPALGDLDGDGDVDLISGNADGRLLTYTNQRSPARISLTVDAVAPAAPVITGPAANAAIYTYQPVITGKAEAQASVTIFIDDTPVTVTAGSAGAYSYAVTGALSLGAHTLRAFAADASGNASNLTSTSFTIRGDTIKGNPGPNTLASGAGDDILIGLGGDDTYLVDSAGDQVLEQAGGGTDTVKASVGYALRAGQSIGVLSTDSNTGTTGIRLTGNALAQAITGNAGNNILNDGAAGAADTLSGLGGNDLYIVNNLGDVVTEAAGAGSDRVNAGVSYGLGAGQSIETLATTSDTGTGAIDLTGNALVQAIIGNAGANTLSDGGAGSADKLLGLGGNDLYIDTDGNGSAAATQFATLSSGLTSLEASQFQVTA